MLTAPPDGTDLPVTPAALPAHGEHNATRAIRDGAVRFRFRLDAVVRAGAYETPGQDEGQAPERKLDARLLARPSSSRAGRGAASKSA